MEEDGTLEWNQRYADNLAVPVMHYTGKEPSEAKLYRLR